MKYKNLQTIMLSLLLFTFACEKEQYDVSSDFNIYVKRFEYEASLRNINLNIENQGLKVEFADFSDETYSGLCHYENPIRIEIDKTYWNNSDDLDKEFIMFHELAHGFLNSEHRNDTLPNGHWKSMMRGTPANVNEHDFNYSEHRDYYVSELFDVNTPVPSWSQLYPNFIVTQNIEFGTILINSTFTEYISITNYGKTNANITKIVTPTDFICNWTGTVNINQEIKIPIIFSPKQHKNYSDIIQIYFEPCNPLDTFITISISGKGVDPNQSDIWIPKSDFGGVERSEALGFSIQGKGYIGLGITNVNGITTFLNDIMEYNPTNDTWITKTLFPGVHRRNASCFVIQDKVYIGGGWYSSDWINFTFFTDFWEYSPLTNEWKRKADLPFQYFYSSNFTINNNGYALSNGSLYKYDPLANQWSYETTLNNAINEHNYIQCFSVNNNKAFVLLERLKQLWEYDTNSKTWLSRADFVSTSRRNGISFTIGYNCYYGCGNTSMFDGTGVCNDFYKYNVIDNSWTQISNAGDNIRDNAVAFSIFDKGYIGTGSGGAYGIGWSMKDFWEYKP